MTDRSEHDERAAQVAAAPVRRPWWRRAFGTVMTLAVMAGVASGIVIWTRPPANVPGAQGPSGPAAMMRGGGGRFARDAPVPVLVATASIADVPVTFDGVGTTRALNTVTVRSQVDGRLLRLNFREGEDVEKGFVLAEIEPTIYQAALDQAIAKKAQDEANLANAKIDLDRYARLAQSNAATRQQLDTQRALVAQLEALVKADQGAIDNARAYLDYTKIVAPISGRTGIRLVDVGNLVKAADATGIVVITQLRPIYVIFTLPQQQLGAVVKAFGEGRLPVTALGTDNRSALDRGVLQVIDNQVDQTTGTVRMRAEFPNADLQLWPGQFVNVELRVDTLEKVVVVPTAAVQRGPNGTFTYVVRDDDTVTVRPVAVTQQDDRRAVIANGLAAGERIVTTGFAQLTEGRRVTVATTEERPSGAPSGEAPRRGPPQAGAPGERRRGAQSGSPPESPPGAAGAAQAGAPRSDASVAR